MLSPNVNDVSSRLAIAYSNVIALKGYAYACNNIRIAKLPADPQWLPAVRNRISLLSDQSGMWMLDEPTMWSQVLLAFINYTTLFAGFTDVSKEFTTKEEWLEVLAQLKTGLQQSKNALTTAAASYESHRLKFQNIQTLLDQSIEEGWDELATEEQAMVNIATQLQKLEDKLGSLQDDLSGSELRSGQSFVQSSVTIMYGLVTVAGSSVSFLSMAGLAFTIGKSFYDVFKNNADVADTLSQIGVLQQKASFEAQAAAATKLVLYTVYSLEKEFLNIQQNLPYLASIFAAESDKVDILIRSLNAGADPARMIDLQSMKPALATWQTIMGYCERMKESPLPGQDVTINIPESKS